MLNLPNIITCCNLLCGCMAIYFGFHGEIGWASLSIILGAIFDFFDGLAARALGISGPIGKELDSLADQVTFGVAPAVLCYSIIGSFFPTLSWLPLLSFVMTAFSALRLAKFNCDERQTLSFIGLPTPANALLWIGLSYVNMIPAVHAVANPWIVLGLMLGCSVLLISEIPMFSLKIKPGHMAWSENMVRYSFLILTVALFILFACIGQLPASLAPIILLYIAMSCFQRKEK